MNTILKLILVAALATPFVAVAQTAEKKEVAPVRIVEPVVPYEYAQMRITGNATLLFEINEEGRAVNIEVEDYSHPVFARSAENALRDWRFEPVKENGQPVTQKVRLPFVFN